MPRRSRGEGSISYDKRRKRYRVRITVGWELNEETGRSKQITKTLGSNYKTKGEATKALAEYLRNPYDLSNKDITFEHLYTKWFDENMGDGKSSMAYRVRAAYKYCSEIYKKKVVDITILDMKNCINKGTTISTRGKFKGQNITASPQTKESIKYLFNHVMAYATEARLIQYNIAKEFSLDKKVEQEKEEQHKVKVPFSVEQLKKLYKSMEFVPFADMVLYHCYSGWRPIEIVNIQIEDVHLDEMYIQGGTKTESGKNRIVPIHPDIKFIIKKYYDEAVSIGSKFLFNDINAKRGIGLSYGQYTKRFDDIIKILGFSQEFTPHCCRHTFITLAKSDEVKMNEYALKLIVGHKIKDITESVYGHRSLENLQKEIKKIKVVKS